MGRPLTRKSARRRGEGAEPSGGLSDPQSSPAYRPQTSLQGTLGDLTSPAIFKAQLIPAANRVQAPAKTSAACFVADALALPWDHLRCTPASGASPTAQHRGGPTLFAHTRLDGGA